MTLGKDKHAPAPAARVADTLKLDVSWLLAHVTAEGVVAFSIDRAGPQCHTPRRNRQVDEALEFLARLSLWGAGVSRYVASHTGREKDLNPRPAAFYLKQFSPLFATFVFEPDREDEEAASATPFLSGDDVAKLQAEEEP